MSETVNQVMNSPVRRPVTLTLPDGSRREFPAPVTGAELAAAIGQALALDDDERAAFGRRARAQVASTYTREIMCARTIEVYEELLFPHVNRVREYEPVSVVA